MLGHLHPSFSCTHGGLSVLIFILFINGFIVGSDVTQTSILWKNKGDGATMNCSHTKDINFYQMYWYRQLPGETMELIVFTTTTSKDFGKLSQDKFSASKPDARTGTFTVKNLESGDKGLYFCAVSQHSDTDTTTGTKLTVLDPTRNISSPYVTVLPPSPNECQKEKHVSKTIVCVATRFYPDHVTLSWDIDGKNIAAGVATDADAQLDDDGYKITSRLRVSAQDWFTPGKKFTCTVTACMESS
uniref:Ig-like domain-containing protein n=1 Tax=Anabas testudineus TaxID=64144 RepID=A0A3Q1JFT8_ANATE